MRPQTLAIDVIMERVPLANRWASERWQPAAVEIVAPRAGAPAPRDLVPGTCETMPADGSGNRWRCKGFELELHPTEAEGYFLNITAPEPRIFVMWRMFDDGDMPPARPVLATLSYNEASRLMDSSEQVDGAPMPPQVAEWMRAFVAEHYKPEPRKKRKRNDPVGDAAAGTKASRR
jgi:hypothetical protein